MAEVEARTHTFIEGVRRYHTAQRFSESRIPAPILWQRGSTKLRDYGGYEGTPQPCGHSTLVLVIPSLINRFTILDILPEQSFLKELAQQGFHPLVVDWDAPADDEVHFTIDHYIIHRILPALEWIRATYPHAPIALVGYCMGGLLALAAAQLRQSDIDHLILLATPWDFHAGNKSDAALLNDYAADRLRTLHHMGHMPVDVLQTMFAVRQPFDTLTKYRRFAEMSTGGDDERRFIALEDWLNDGVPLTIPAAQQAFGDWYGHNLPMVGRWRVMGQVIDPRCVARRSLVVMAARDVIVPVESTVPLATQCPNATVLCPDIGHVGLMASRSSPDTVWRDIVAWLNR